MIGERYVKITTYSMTNSQNKTETVAIGFTKTDNGIEWDDEKFLSKNDPNFLETLNDFSIRLDNYTIKHCSKNIDKEINFLGTRYNKLKKLKG